MAIRRSPIPLALLAGTVAAALSYKDPSPTSVALQAARVKTTSTGSPPPSGLLYCPQTYDSVSQVIGRAGGFITVGAHTLYVDSLVLLDTVTITAVAPADTVRLVRFQPNGLLFPDNRLDGWGGGAFLVTSYKDCGALGAGSVRIAQVDDALGILTYLTTYTQSKKNWWSQGQQSVTGLLSHFSNYAVAW